MSNVVTLEEKWTDGTLVRRWVPYVAPVIVPGTHVVTDQAGNPIVETPGAVRELVGEGKKKVTVADPYRVLMRPHDQMHATRYSEPRAEMRRREWVPDGLVMPIEDLEKLRRSRMSGRGEQ